MNMTISAVAPSIIVVCFALLPIVVPGKLPAAEPQRGGKNTEERPSSLDQIAVESVKDTLKGCLGRIPVDASAGQLLLAEQNCQQVDLKRQKTRPTF